MPLEIFYERESRHPNKRYLIQPQPGGQVEELSWSEVGEQARRAANWLRGQDIEQGSRVAIISKNCAHWIIADLAIWMAGMVSVPLYPNLTAASIRQVLEHSESRVAFIGKLDDWPSMAAGVPEGVQCVGLPLCPEGRFDVHWSELQACTPIRDNPCPAADQLATIIYTSGTTGKPKGVMLTHRNVVSDVKAVLQRIVPTVDDVFLSFLPLSHTFERTGGYYLPIAAGSCVAYARSVPLLAEDLKTVRPTVLVSVPRIYERVHAKLLEKLSPTPWKMQLYEAAQNKGWARFCVAQGLPAPQADDNKAAGWMAALPWPLLQALVAKPLLAQFGGRVRVAVSGGAPLSPTIAKCFLGLGLNLVQGYGMTETAPVVSANSPNDNDPACVGRALPGVEVRIGDNRELQVRGPIVMKGYWKRPEDTAKILSADGWLGTGDQAEIINGRIYIRGRIKEIIVTSTGEKVPPGDLELAVLADPALEQAFVVGENRPFIACVAVIKHDEWQRLAADLGLNPQEATSLHHPSVQRAVLARIEKNTASFPRYAVPRAVHLTLEPWTIENTFMTPTLKLKRNNLMLHFAQAIEGMYQKPAPSAR